MNLIAGLLILACLMGSESIGATAADDLWTRVLAVLITAFIVPALAFFQTSMLLQKMHRENFSAEVKGTLCRRLTVSHTLAWLSASGAIIWGLRWQDVVRGNWQLDRWPLIDEWLILAPIVLSMVASWAVFYQLQAPLKDNEAKKSSQSPQTRTGVLADKSSFFQRFAAVRKVIQPRIDFVSIRFRLYFLIILVPVSGFIFLRDTAGWMSSLPDPVGLTLSVAGMISLMLLMPFLMLVIWKNGQIEDENLRKELREISFAHKLHVYDIRTWRTGYQVLNAAVTGLVPGFRIIFLSDGLLNQFKRDEITAVVRHEAGHIRLWHVPTRLFFLVAPLFAFMFFSQIDTALAGGNIRPNKMMPFSNDVPGWDTSTVLIALLLLAGYQWITMRWLSHQMEYEADLYAIRSDSALTEHQPTSPVCPNHTAAMNSALLRLAAISPKELDRSTLLHPSIRQRLKFLERVSASPEEGTRFQNSFARRRVFFASALILVVLATWILN